MVVKIPFFKKKKKIKYLGNCSTLIIKDLKMHIAIKQTIMADLILLMKKIPEPRSEY